MLQSEVALPSGPVFILVHLRLLLAGASAILTTPVLIVLSATVVNMLALNVWVWGFFETRPYMSQAGL